VTRPILSVSFFLVLSVVVGFLVSGDGQFVDWAVTGGLFALALAGEGVRLWLRRSRSRAKTDRESRRQSSGI
jgi:hypothetical protein